MIKTLHITSGDHCGEILAKSGVDGEVFVWHDIMYDGPREPGWPDEKAIKARVQFIVETTAGGLSEQLVLDTLTNQYKKLESAGTYDRIVLWFDACLFDQSMIVHVLNCLAAKNIKNAELICIDSFPGIVPFDGLGQLTISQMASLYKLAKPIIGEQFKFAKIADDAFAVQDIKVFNQLYRMAGVPLQYIPAAVSRWLQEKPDSVTGMGRLEQLIMNAVSKGSKTPVEIFAAVKSADTHPQFWGDTNLWQKINGLAGRNPPLLKITGPSEKLPQWESKLDLNRFKVETL